MAKTGPFARSSSRFQRNFRLKLANYLRKTRNLLRSPLARTLTYALILKTAGRIYGLDLGKDHHNPQCNQVGEKHKHTWSEQYRDKEAYTPNDITAQVSDPVEVWKQFCKEAGIEHDGELRQPPPTMQMEMFDEY